MTTQDKASPQGVTLLIGGKYNWKGQPERLVYLGHNWSGNGYWHQFALEAEPGVVWCEVLSSDLFMIEKTALSQPTAPEQAIPETGGLADPIAYYLLAKAEWAAGKIEAEQRRGAGYFHAEVDSFLRDRSLLRKWLIDHGWSGVVPKETASPAAKPAAPVAAKPAREWVGLTPEEIDTVYRNIPHPVKHWQLSRAIESKLREKNAALLAADAQAGGEVACNNDECGWNGNFSDTRHLRGIDGGVGPLCPECGETAEPQPCSLGVGVTGPKEPADQQWTAEQLSVIRASEAPPLAFNKIGINGLTEAETAASASVIGISRKDQG